MKINEQCDVVIIGAGPSGAIAAGILVQKGWRVKVVEKELFPRFSIGESLLPQCMEFIEEAGMLDTMLSQANNLGFQFKNGAAFYRNGEHSNFDFSEKFSDGASTTFQVKRASFDKLLADKAQDLGADIRYQHEVIAVDFMKESALVSIKNADKTTVIETQFVLDASGFGRVLPKLLSLDLPSTLSDKRSLFCHLEDNIETGANAKTFDRNKILITVHPTKNDIWFWLIPFADGSASYGVVGNISYFDVNKTDEEMLDEFTQQEPHLARLLSNAKKVTPVRSLQGYSADVSRLYGERFALLGNAGEFLDPVFSSGVTIAMCSASLAANLLDQQLLGTEVCWQQQFSEPLKKGIEVFKHFVMSWYDTDLQNIIFFQEDNNEVKAMICSILAGYAWDDSNPYVNKTERRLSALIDICQPK